MPSREYAWLVQESSYGTPIASPTTGTTAFYPRLHDSDGYTGQMNPVLLDIPYGGGFNTPACQVSDQYTTPFNFRTYLYAGNYSKFLMGWCLTPIDATRVSPWTTTDPTGIMPPGDLASISIYHAIMRSDGTYDLRRYGGAKVATWRLTCSRAAPIFLLNITGFAVRDDLNAAGVQAYPTATEFPPPTETSYPCNPYMFSHTAGNLLLIDTGSVVRTQYDSVDIGSTNIMDAKYFETQYMQFYRFLGRTTTMNTLLHLKPTPDDLFFLQHKVQLTSKLVMNNGTNSLTFDMHTVNYLKTVARQLTINQVYKRNVSVQNFWDPLVPGDITLTAA
jgi:hypothetical protein